MGALSTVRGAVRRGVWLVCAVGVALALVLPRAAWAFDVPPIEGHVTDLTRTLDASQIDALNGQMEAVNQASTVELAVLVLPSLGGEPIEDVAYQTARKWKLGKAGKDNGALLVIATGDRRTHIEIGKGIEGNLTDLQSNDILRKKVGPELRQGHLFEGIGTGVTAIAAAAAGQYTTTPDANGDSEQGRPLSKFAFFIILLILIAFIVLRRLFFGGFWGGGGWGGGGFWGGGSGGGGDGGGGGFTGGGGDFGGGGSSDSY